MFICTVSFLILFVMFVHYRKKGFRLEDHSILPFFKRWRKAYLEKEQIRILSFVSILFPTQEPEEKMLKLREQRYYKVLIGILLVLFLGMVRELSVCSKGNSFLKENTLLRPKPSEGSTSYTIKVGSQGMEEKEYTIKIEEEEYDEEERTKAFTRAKEYLDLVFLGENESREDVRYPLSLVKTIKDESMTVSWILDEKGIINKDGSISEENLAEEQDNITIQAVIKYRDFEEAVSYDLCVRATEKTAAELFYESWEGALNQILGTTKEEAYVPLPDKIMGQEVTYQEKKENPSILFFLLAIMTGFLLGKQSEQELSAMKKKREEEMMMDYPGLVNKLVLLLGAGMTIDGAFETIRVSYQRQVSENPLKKRYAYEEICRMQKEIKNGKSGIAAYEAFGRRAQCSTYLRFSTLLAQNVRKGSNHILGLLELEAVEAYEKRKERAKRKGEEAGTKLLAPMLLQLLLVMALIMIPAFLSF
ncbi:MAG: tight adherence protein [Clostridiales bacterium]|nr:tight adherence protein [Clostridiales bacterium]